LPNLKRWFKNLACLTHFLSKKQQPNTYTKTELMKTKLLLLLFSVGLLLQVSIAQTTETFETQTNNATTFTSNAVTFNLALGTNAISFHVSNQSGLGYAGSNFFLQADDNVTNTTYGQICNINVSSGAFKVTSLWVYVTGNAAQTAGTTSNGAAGSVTFRGKLAGATVFTVTKTSGLSGTNNGFAFVDFTTEGGSNNSNTSIDKLEIELSSNYDYFAIDNFIWNAGAVAPTVTSTAATGIGGTSAVLGGNVTASGGATVTERGIVWATTNNPTTSNNKVANGSGTGTYSGTVSSLPSATTIYFRAYAINSQGTSYGGELNFTTAAALSSTIGGTAPSCNGGCNGSASVTPSGGSGGYTYSWAPSGGTGSTASSLCTGNYTCTITDNVSAQITKTVTLTAPSAITATTSQTSVSCNGGSNGSAAVSASGGTGSLSYSWSPSGGTSATATGLSTGNYTCTITDANTCSITKTVAVATPTAITATTSQTSVSCNGGTNGSAAVSASGGTGSLSY
jgi:hypothetical protein